MNIIDSAAAYEIWLSDQLRDDLVTEDLDEKHKRMAEAPFPFLRATYWRWAETILDICPELASAPQVLAIGDIHLENYGTWRDDEGRLIWGVNDFDEAAEMPYVLDLVRLGTSATLGCPHFDSVRDIAANILEGYQLGLKKPHAVVLDDDYAWLRKLVVVPNKERQHFWDKMDALKPPRKPVKPKYRRAVVDAMPEPKARIDYRRRTAGLGSLGRPRFVGKMEWRGGLVVREAKAALPSAWTLPKGRRASRLRCYEIATGTYRAPDQWYAVNDGVIVRRLSPNNRKLDAETHPLDLIDARMLGAMAHDLASIHLGRVNASAAIGRDLKKRKDGWLRDAIKAAAAFVRSEQKEWKKGRK